MHRVHDRRHPGDPRGDAAVDPGLGVVRVHDVGAELPEAASGARRAPRDPDRERTSGSRVCSGTWRMPLRSSSAENVPGRRHPDHLVARVRERLELRSEEQRQADVGRGDVDEARPGHRQRSPLTWSRPRTGAGSARAAACPPAPCRPPTLRRNHCMPSATWIGERARRYGSVDP